MNIVPSLCIRLQSALQLISAPGSHRPRLAYAGISAVLIPHHRMFISGHIILFLQQFVKSGCGFSCVDPSRRSPAQKPEATQSLTPLFHNQKDNLSPNGERLSNTLFLRKSQKRHDRSRRFFTIKRIISPRTGRDYPIHFSCAKARSDAIARAASV